MDSLKGKSGDAIVIGLAVFAMFFGAGSLIFPPYLGMTAGDQWSLGFFCFFITDIGLAFVTVVAMVRGTGNISGITGVIGKVPSTIINTVVLVCIGPLFVVPRSAATTYEMTIVPLLPQVSQGVFSIIFFGIVLFLAIRPTRIVDILGKYLTPLMVLALIVMILVGILAPIGDIGQAVTKSVVKDGIIAGYQAMDVLGALTVAIIVIATIKERGYDQKEAQVKIASKACFVAGIMLFAVYGGLTYLGATVSLTYDVATINQASLIVAITGELLGFWGTLLLGTIVGLACLTTAVGVASAVASYFVALLQERISYKVMITVIVVFSTGVSNFGLSTIISFAGPILSIVYPTVITLIILSFFHDKIGNKNIYRGATIVAFSCSLLTVMGTLGLPFAFMGKLPLAAYGFEWLLPTCIGGVIASFVKEKHV